MLIPLIVSGFANGMVYALLAIAFVLVYKATRVFNLAQGALALLGTYMTFAMLEWLHLPLLLAIPLVLLLSILIGFVLGQFVLRRMAGRNASSLIILTLMMNTALISVVGLIWGPGEKAFPRVFPSTDVNVLGTNISTLHIWVSIACLAVILLFYFIYDHTQLGLAMRTSASNLESAALMGVDGSTSSAVSWALAGAIGSLAGVFLAAEVTLSLKIWYFVLMAFPAAVMGGIDSIFGALVGGVVMGVLEALAGGYVDPLVGGGVKQSMATVVLFLVLMLRPSGLFGAKEIERL